MPTTEILIHVLDQTRELQLLTSTGKLEMLRYLLNMVEHEAEIMLMDEQDSSSEIFTRQRPGSCSG